jgi:hypothetical protein
MPFPSQVLVDYVRLYTNEYTGKLKNWKILELPVEIEPTITRFQSRTLQHYQSFGFPSALKVRMGIQTMD